jgi:hypothetical protein
LITIIISWKRRNIVSAWEFERNQTFPETEFENLSKSSDQKISEAEAKLRVQEDVAEKSKRDLKRLKDHLLESEQQHAFELEEKETTIGKLTLQYCV